MRPYDFSNPIYDRLSAENEKGVSATSMFASLELFDSEPFALADTALSTGLCVRAYSNPTLFRAFPPLSTKKHPLRSERLDSNLLLLPSPHPPTAPSAPGQARETAVIQAVPTI